MEYDYRLAQEEEMAYQFREKHGFFPIYDYHRALKDIKHPRHSDALKLREHRMRNATVGGSANNDDPNWVSDERSSISNPNPFK